MNPCELFYISNILSLLRIVLILPIYYLLQFNTQKGNLLTVAVMLTAAMTDALDGALARKLNQRSDLGRILDPLADKIAIAALFFALVTMRGLPVWYLVLVVGRDLLILFFAAILMRRTKIVVESNMLGKTTVCSLVLVVIFFTLRLGYIEWIFLWFSVAWLVASSVGYFLKMRELMTASSQ